MWAPFTLETKRLLEGAGSRSPEAFAKPDPVALLREILSSRDPHISALVTDLGISNTSAEIDKFLSTLEQDRTMRPVRLRNVLDTAIRRCASQGRYRVNPADLLVALLSDRKVAAGLRNAGFNVERVLTTLS